jgi:Cytochrome c7 and related cytochrome c
MKALRAHVVLVACVAVAACGGGASETPPATSVTASSSANLSSESANAAVSDAGAPLRPPSPTASSAGLPIPPSSGPPAAAREMNAPAPSVMLSDLQALGLEPESLSPIEKIEPRALRRVMKVLAKSLGAKCTDCHLDGDFAAMTRRKRIAAKMWDEFVVNLTMADGSAIFCDSCHKGRILQLDRSDKKLLESEMDANFVHGLKRKDGADIACETCHVAKDMHFLEKWGAAK